MDAITKDLMTVISAASSLFAAVAALIAAIKSASAHAEVKALRAQQPAAVPGLNAGDLFRYAALIQQGLALVKQAGRLAVGQTAPVPKVTFDVPDGERLSLAATSVTRER